MAAESYFLKRNIENEEAMHRNLDAKEAVMLESYIQAQDYLNKQVKKIYDRYLNKSGLDEVEVRKILNTSASLTDLAELQRLSKSLTDKEIQSDVKAYLNGLAVKHRISLLETLKAKAYLVAKQIANVQLDTQTDFYIDTIREAYEEAATEAIVGQTEQKITIKEGQYPKFVATKSQEVLQIRDIQTEKVVKKFVLQPDPEVPEFKEMSTTYVKNILESEWKGSNYSKRIWGDTDLLAKRLEELFTVKNLTGMSESEMAKILANKFDTSMYVARRLVRTESNYMAGQAKLRSWKAHGVDKYILIAVLDFRTSAICRSIDGKIYDVEKAVCNGKDGNYPPFHPWCRTIPAAYFGERTLDGKRTANDPLAKKTFEIDQRTNYKEWEEMLTKRHGKEEIETFRKKVKNLTADIKQFNRYKAALGDEFTYKTVDDFQNVKYADPSVYEKLKDLYAKAIRK